MLPGAVGEEQNSHIKYESNIPRCFSHGQCFKFSFFKDKHRTFGIVENCTTIEGPSYVNVWSPIMPLLSAAIFNLCEMQSLVHGGLTLT